MSLVFHNNFLLDTKRPYLERKTKTLHTRKVPSSAWHAAGVHRPAYHKKNLNLHLVMRQSKNDLRGAEVALRSPARRYRTLEAMPCQHAGLFRTSLGGVALLSFQQVQDADRAHTDSRRRRAAHTSFPAERGVGFSLSAKRKPSENKSVVEKETLRQRRKETHTQVR